MPRSVNILRNTQKRLGRKVNIAIKRGLGGNNMSDAINPSHYQRKEAMECIDEMILVFGRFAVADFCKCNAWKYRYRAADKNGAEDIAKSDWYMRKYKELMGEFK